MSDQQRRCVVVVLAAVALATAVSPRPAAAQTSTNNAGIEGRVADDSGAVLPGVTVTIQSPALQSAQLEAVSDAAGRYRFTTLPGGEYTVTFSLPGFRTMVRQGLKLGSGFVATVDAQLALGQLEESITVTGDSPLVDVRTTTEATNIKKELMETIPTSRSYADVGKLAPGVRLSGLPDIGGSQTGGQRGNLVSYGSNAGGQTLMLDGVNTDGTGGYFDFGAIEEMIVRPGGNDAEIPTSGMAFQIITKSGGNDFHGDGLAAWQGQNLQGNNIDDDLRAEGRHRRQPDGSLLRFQRVAGWPHPAQPAVVLRQRAPQGVRPGGPRLLRWPRAGRRLFHCRRRAGNCKPTARATSSAS